MTTHTFDLVGWEAPFSQSRFPSVGVIPESDDVAELTVVVAPQGIDRYPKFLARFFTVVAFRCEDESLASMKRFRSLKLEEPRACTYLWQDSPWLQEYVDSQRLIDVYYSGELRHYIFFGGDVIVEVLTTEEPEVEEIFKPKVITTYRV